MTGISTLVLTRQSLQIDWFEVFMIIHGENLVILNHIMSNLETDF